MLPMLATLEKSPFNSDSFIYELKWDGFRCLSIFKNGKAFLKSKKGNSLKFKKISDEIDSVFTDDIILDGEIIVLNNKGYSDFDALVSNHTHPRLAYMVFDIIQYKDTSYLNYPCIERKKILKSILPQSDIIRYVDYVEYEGTGLFSLTEQHCFEGIVAKQKDSVYQPGEASKNWLKIKNREYMDIFETRNRFKPKGISPCQG